MPKRRGTLILSIGVTLVVAGLIVWFSGQSAADSDSLSHGMARRLMSFISSSPKAAGRVFRMSCSTPAVLRQEVCFLRFLNIVCSKE